jgi:cell division protein FtsW (lipid II flippase)
MTNAGNSIDWLRQSLNVVFALAMPVTTWLTFSRGATVPKSILTSPKDPPIVPATYAFSIWGLIYAAAIAYAIYQALPSQRDNALLRQIGFATASAFFFTALWLVLARAQLLWLTVACIFAILVSLVPALLRVSVHTQAVSGAERWLIEMPVSIFAGWITVAAFANVAAAIQFSGWGAVGPGETGWSVILLALAGVMALILTFMSRGNVFYAATILWALIAISVANMTKQKIPIMAGSALVLALLTLLMSAFRTLENRHG